MNQAFSKKEYIVDQLHKSASKKYENYCISRIIAKLDNLDIKFITQKLLRRKNGEIALADLYFPQIDFWVEIDESYHNGQTDKDTQRTKEVLKEENAIRSKLAKFEEVPLRLLDDPARISIFDENREITIEEINAKIDEIVLSINEKIQQQVKKGTFLPWKTVYETPDFYKKRGYLLASEDARFSTIWEVSELFNKGYKKGTQKCWFPVGKKQKGYEYVWCPKLKLYDCDFSSIPYRNTLSEDGLYIYESAENDNDTFVSNPKCRNEIRYVFPFYRDESGKKSYKFIGIYTFDEEETNRNNNRARAWKRKKTRLDFRNC